MTDRDECLQNPCVNNSTCINTLGSYTCRCGTGWTGKHCELGKYYITHNSTWCISRNVLTSWTLNFVMVGHYRMKKGINLVSIDIMLIKIIQHFLLLKSPGLPLNTQHGNLHDRNSKWILGKIPI